MAERLGISAEMLSLITSYAVKIIGVLVLLFLGWVVSGWVRRVTLRGLDRSKLDPTLAKFFSNLSKYLILVVVVIAALGIFGVQTTSFAAIIAAVGFAVGLGFQNSLSNFSAGVMLLIFRPFRVGQYVSVAGVSGTVNEIELFTTTLDTPDNRRLIVPNGQIFSGTIENFSHHPIRRVDVSVGTDYNADIEEVREVLSSVAAGIPGQPDDKPYQVALLDLGESAINWQVRVWSSSDTFWANHEKLVQDIKSALDSKGIGIPFPQRALHFETPLERVAKEHRPGPESPTSVN